MNMEPDDPGRGCPALPFQHDSTKPLDLAAHFQHAGHDTHPTTFPMELGNQESVPANVPVFNATSWFSRFSENGSPIEAQDLQPVLEFTLLWNLFERETCDRFVQLPAIRRHVDRAFNGNNLQLASYTPFLEFFRSRYPNHSEEEFLADLLLSSRRRRSTNDLQDIALLQRVLEGTCTDLNNIVFSLLFVAYRVRNNLFHGEKDIYTLHLQRALFITINSLLAVYMEEACQRIRQRSFSREPNHGLS